MAGDPSDNIPGVPGIGPKIATGLLQDFDTLENLYQAIEKSQEKVIAMPHRQAGEQAKQSDNKIATVAKGNLAMTEETIEKTSEELNIKPRILQLLIENKEQAFLSQKLATIHKDVPIEFKLEDCVWDEYDKDKLKEFFEELGFKSLLKRFGKSEDRKIEKSKNQEKDVIKKNKSQLKLL